MKKINIQQTLYNTFGKWGALTLRCNHCDFKSPFPLQVYYTSKENIQIKRLLKKTLSFV